MRSLPVVILGRRRTVFTGGSFVEADQPTFEEIGLVAAENGTVSTSRPALSMVSIRLCSSGFP